MSSDLRDLYQEVILDHYKRPRNFRAMENADRTAVGYNPLCGDRITLYLRMAGEEIQDATFQGQGCAICTASTSMMTDAVKGRTTGEADALFQEFHRLVTAPPDVDVEAPSLGKLEVFAGVREFPARVKCASLAWHTLRAALHGRQQATTE